MVIPIKNGLNGSAHANAEVTPLTPAEMAKTGVIQQIEDAIAVKNPIPINLPPFSIFDLRVFTAVKVGIFLKMDFWGRLGKDSYLQISISNLQFANCRFRKAESTDSSYP